MMLGVILFVLAQAETADAPEFDLSRLRAVSAIKGCDTTRGDIVVCGRRTDRYRLPLPRDPDPDARTPREVPGGMAALTPAAPCGIFKGQRTCRKAEAKRYGYGGGRDPLSVAGKLVGALVKPD